MKKFGLKPDQAAAYEVAASTGGQIMLPAMGAAALVMAEFTEYPYIKIVKTGTYGSPARLNQVRARDLLC